MPWKGGGFRDDKDPAASALRLLFSPSQSSSLKHSFNVPFDDEAQRCCVSVNCVSASYDSISGGQRQKRGRK